MARCQKCNAFLIKEGAYIGQCCNPICEDGFLRIASDAIHESIQLEQGSNDATQEAEEWSHPAIQF